MKPKKVSLDPDGALAELVKRTSIFQGSFFENSDLSEAVNTNDMNQFRYCNFVIYLYLLQFIFYREIIKIGSENTQTILETIVKRNNSSLLEEYLKENEFKVVGGKLEYNKRKIKIYKFAAKKCSFKCIFIFINLGVEMDEEEKDEVMKAAIEENNMDLIQTLLERTRKIGIVEMFLKHAAAFGNTTALEIIVQKYHEIIQSSVNRDLDTFDAKRNVTIEMHEIQTPRKLSSKFDFRRFYENSNTCLHVAAKNPSNLAIELMELIIENFPHLLEAQNDKGRTPLHEAARGLFLIWLISHSFETHLQYYLSKSDSLSILLILIIQ